MNNQKTNLNYCRLVWLQPDRWCWGIQRLRVTQDLDLTPGDNPRSVFAFCVASTCHLSSRRVVWRLLSRHQGKLSLEVCYFQAQIAASTRWCLHKVWRCKDVGLGRFSTSSCCCCLEGSYGSDLGPLCLSEPLQSAKNPTSPACLSPGVCDSSSQDFSII